MRITIVFFILIAITEHCCAQYRTITKSFAVKAATMPYWQGQLVIAGLVENSKKTELLVMLCDSMLNRKDSIQFTLSNRSIENYLPIQIDTTQVGLQILAQDKTSDVIHYLRIDSTWRVVATQTLTTAEKLRQLRWNDHSQLKSEDRVLELMPDKEKSEKTIYLNCYRQQSTTNEKNKVQAWQQVFNRPGLMSVQLLQVTKQFVYLSATYFSAGNYQNELVKLNLSQGHVVTTYIIHQGPESFRICKTSFSDNGDLLLSGQVMKDNELSLWYCAADSFMLKFQPVTFKLPVSPLAASQKTFSYFLTITSHSWSPQNEKYSVCFDNYTSSNQNMYRLTNKHQCFNVVKGQITPNAELPLKPDILLQSVYNGNGKNSVWGQYQFAAGENPVCARTFSNSSENYFYPLRLAGKEKLVVLIKDGAKQSIGYYLVGGEKTVTTTKLLQSVSMLQQPQSLPMSSRKFVIGWQSAPDMYVVKLIY